MLDKLTKADFIDLGAPGLLVDVAGQSLRFLVTESRDLPPISPRPNPFSIVIEGPSTPSLMQGIYAFTHPQHGRLDLFIVPISRDSAHTRYEIIFN